MIDDLIFVLNEYPFSKASFYTAFRRLLTHLLIDDGVVADVICQISFAAAPGSQNLF